jgi:hypothetical protein
MRSPFLESNRILLRTLATGLIMLLHIALFPIRSAAHPLDEFYQVTFISVGADAVDLAVELFPGVLVAPQVIAVIDTDGDEEISTAEAERYARQFVADVVLEINGSSTPLTVGSVEMPPLLELQAGIGVIRLSLKGDTSTVEPGDYTLFYENNHFAERGIYIVNAISTDPEQVQIVQP